MGRHLARILAGMRIFGPVAWALGVCLFASLSGAEDNLGLDASLGDGAVFPAERPGAATHDAKTSYSVGVTYSRTLAERLEMEVGARWLATDERLSNYPYPDGAGRVETHALRYLVVPVSVRQKLGGSFSVDGGVVLDLLLGSDEADTRSGVGLALGLRTEHRLGRTSCVFFSPFLTQHSALALGPGHYRLLEFGIRVGLRHEL